MRLVDSYLIPLCLLLLCFSVFLFGLASCMDAVTLGEQGEHISRLETRTAPKAVFPTKTPVR